MRSKPVKLICLGAILLALIAALAFWQRHRLIVMFAGPGEPAHMLEDAVGIPNAEWFDDYYAVVAIDERTFAIAEPHYWQRNFNYLIVGDENAVLFDAGNGFRDIRPVVQSLTKLPVTFIPSHFHFDHIGSHALFERVALVDLPHLRNQAEGNRLTLTWQQHLGEMEGTAEPTVEITDWMKPNSTIELGNRSLRVLYTPGHTDDSISLLDSQNSLVFTGDFLYPGPLAAIFPNSGMGDYLQGVENLLVTAPANSRLFGAHRIDDGEVPTLRMHHVVELRDALIRIKRGEMSGSGIYPLQYQIGQALELWAEPIGLQKWQPTYQSQQLDR